MPDALARPATAPAATVESPPPKLLTMMFALARMELNESVSHLFSTYPDLALDGEPESRGTFVLRGYRSVPVTKGRP